MDRMEETGKIVTPGESEVIIKKSRFLGYAAAAKSPEEAADIVSGIRKEHYSARHVCYAYSIGEKNPLLKFSDDGEPQGTAGKPILDVVTRSGVSDILIVVTRYFGGILLGTGGLVRAYTEAADEALKQAEIVKLCMCSFYNVQLDYSDFEPVRYILSGHGIAMNPEYGEAVNAEIKIPVAIEEMVVKSITEKTAGRAVLAKTGERMG